MKMFELGDRKCYRHISVTLDFSALNYRQKEEFKNFFTRFRKLFSNTHGLMQATLHEIDTEDSGPAVSIHYLPD